MTAGLHAAEVTDLGIERLVRIEERISRAEDTGLRARWEFGHELLAARDGKGRLPNGYLKAIVERTGASRQELGYRQLFAERFPTEEQLTNAVGQFKTWHQIVKVGLARTDDSEGDGWSSPLAVPDGQFATIVADPPWRYGNTSTRGAAEDHYPTMTIDELCELDIDKRAADQAHLYLWTTAGHLPEAFRVMEAWAFDYKTYLVWVKPQMGMGNYFRVSTELVLFGVRGGLRTRDLATVNYFEARRGRHSAKPRRRRVPCRGVRPPQVSRRGFDRSPVADGQRQVAHGRHLRRAGGAPGAVAVRRHVPAAPGRGAAVLGPRLPLAG